MQKLLGKLKVFLSRQVLYESYVGLKESRGPTRYHYSLVSAPQQRDNSIPSIALLVE